MKHFFKTKFHSCWKWLIFQALAFCGGNPQLSSKPRHRRLETKVYDSKERLSFMAELLQQLTLLCWDKAISRRVWSWLRRNSFKSSPPPVLVYGVSQADRKVRPYAIARPSLKSRERLCSARSSSRSHEANGLSTCRLANAEVPKQLPALPAFLAPKIHFFKP